MSSFGQEILQMVRQFSQIDIAASPGIVFLGKMRSALIKQSFDAAAAEQIAAGMEVQITQGTLSDEELDEIADLYAGMIVKIYDALEAQGFKDPLEAVKRQASSMSLKC